jgi:hypothetical protein
MLQGVYGENVKGPVHGNTCKTMSGFLLGTAKKITKISVSKTYLPYLTLVLQGRCVKFQPGNRPIVGSLTFDFNEGPAYSAGETWKYSALTENLIAGVPNTDDTSTSFSTSIPDSCTLAFISGRGGVRVDAIMFWWIC